MDIGAYWAIVHGVVKSQTGLSDEARKFKNTKSSSTLPTSISLCQKKHKKQKTTHSAPQATEDNFLFSIDLHPTVQSLFDLLGVSSFFPSPSIS